MFVDINCNHIVMIVNKEAVWSHTDITVLHCVLNSRNCTDFNTQRRIFKQMSRTVVFFFLEQHGGVCL